MGTAITPPAVKDTALGRVGRVRPGMDASNRQCGNCRVVIFRGLVCSAICAATGGGGTRGRPSDEPKRAGARRTVARSGNCSTAGHRQYRQPPMSTRRRGGNDVVAEEPAVCARP